MSDAPYACPRCRAPLARDGDHYPCAACHRQWPVVRGIPSFCEAEFYWNHVPREQMPGLLRTAREQGYRQALEDFLLPRTSDYVLRYALDERRADFRVLLPLTRESRVLDLGPGWGAITTALARACGSVVGADATVESLEFVAVRAQQEGLSNVQPVHVSPLDFARLPFADGGFDAAIMNGVLEWVGTTVLDAPVPALQRAALQEVRRVLKPGGALYVGIENRYSILYWAGQRDHHGLRFTSLMPRTLADLLCRWRLGSPYRTYTYSRRGYEALLASAGFDRVAFHLPLPTYHRPHYLLPLNGAQPLRYLLGRLMAKSNSPSRARAVGLRLARVAAPLRLHEHLSPGFAITARAARC